MYKCQGLKCKQFDIYRIDKECDFECTCRVTNEKLLLSSDELQKENAIICPEGSFNPITPNKCRGIFCKHFTVYNDCEDSYNCKCEKSGEWIDLWEEELDKENELNCPNNAFELAETTLYPAPMDID